MVDQILAVCIMCFFATERFFWFYWRMKDCIHVFSAYKELLHLFGQSLWAVISCIYWSVKVKGYR
jgi:hypothetical protein